MEFFRLRMLYLYLLSIICVLFHLYVLSIFFFLILLCWIGLKRSIEELIFMSYNKMIDSDWALYSDYETDLSYYYNIMNGSDYLIFNCRFFFYFYGGPNLLSELDCLDIIIYSLFDSRNFKYIYNDIFIKKYYNKKDYFFLYEFDNKYIKKYNLKYNLKLLNNKTYSVLVNSNELEKVKNKKKEIYIKN